MNINTVIDVPADGAYFEGHFPGRPILPGVAELALVLAALERAGNASVSLAGISFVRLRQIVLPGERLELSTRMLASGNIRFDLKRAGVLVANGELLLGPLVVASADRVITSTSVDPSLAREPLDALLPHRAPMRFVQTILSMTAEQLICEASIPARCPLVGDGRVPAVVALEAAAQAAAAWEALQRRQAAGDVTARIGYLVALRDVVFYAPHVPADQRLVIRIELDACVPPLSHYRVRVSCDEQLIVTGTIATFLTEQVA